MSNIVTTIPITLATASPAGRSHSLVSATAKKTQQQQQKTLLEIALSPILHPFQSISFTSPRTVVIGGCFELMALLYFFSQVRLLEGDYFRVGVPVTLFQYEVTSNTEFLYILVVFFFHQTSYTWITETLNPWLLNEVQDHKCQTIRYSKLTTLSVINIYQTYLTLNNILVLNIAFSQFTFLLVILLADLISNSTINLRYIWHKDLLDQNLKDDIEAQFTCKDGYFPIPEPSPSTNLQSMKP